MDPRRLQRIRAAAEEEERRRRLMADSSESEAVTGYSDDATVKRRRAAVLNAALGAGGGGSASPDTDTAMTQTPNGSLVDGLVEGGSPTGTGGRGSGGAAATSTSGRAGSPTATRRERITLAALLHVPLMVLLLWFRRGAEDLPHTLGSNPWAILGVFAAFAALPILSEVQSSASKAGLLASLFLQGVLSGSMYLVVQHTPIFRCTAMILMGNIAGNLRFQWGTRRLSRRMPHTLKARTSNFLKRTIGYMPALIAGEMLGCMLFVPHGWIIISQSWFGYAMVLMFPFAFVSIGNGLTKLLTLVFGGDHKHVLGNDSLTRLQLVRWTAGVTIAAVILVGSVGYIAITYGGYAWANQLLMAPYACFVEVLTYKAHRAQRRGRSPSTNVAGREAYTTYTRQHRELINNLMAKKAEFHTH